MMRIVERLTGRSIHFSSPELSIAVITDARHRNEILELGDRLGKGWKVVKVRIRRPAFGNEDGHASEAEQLSLDDEDFDELVLNDEGLEKLGREARRLLDRYVAA